MAITVSQNFPPLASTPLSTRALMREIGLVARERLIKRTTAGRDEKEATFRPYSRAYAQRKAQELGAGPVNLQVSGAMLNAITILEVTEDSVTLGFSS